MSMISVAPTKEEKSILLKVAKAVLAEIEKETALADSRIKPVLVGSASRDTWLPNEKDLDVFLLFPPEYEKGQMEKIVTDIGRKILEDVTKRYAEHPYVRGRYRDFEVEIVPCYAVDSPSDLKSAVDRTPFHDAFVKEHVAGKENEVRLLKQFLKGIGCYGAEARVEGFSGYLCELLVIRYGSFEDVLKGAADWQRGRAVWIGDEPDIEEGKFTEALVFIDPVDSNRNVASALSSTKLSQFIFAAGKYLEDPRDEFFFPKTREANLTELVNIFENRGTGAIAIIFDMPDLVDDILYPQLRRAINRLEKLLLKSEFPLLGIDFFVADGTCIFIELGSSDIPEMRLHRGPKVNTSHEERFLSKYREFEGKLTEPFIIGDRWAIFLKRKYTSAVALISDFLSGPDLEKDGVPKYVAKSIRKGHEIKEGKDAILAEFADGLLDYFDPRLPWESS